MSTGAAPVSPAISPSNSPTAEAPQALGTVSFNFRRLFQEAVDEWRVKILSESFLRAVGDDRVKSVLTKPIFKLEQLGLKILSPETNKFLEAPGSAPQFITSLLSDLKIGIADLIVSRQLPPAFAPIVMVLSRLQRLGSIEGGDPRSRAKAVASLTLLPQIGVDFAKKILASDAVQLKLTAPLDPEKATVVDALKRVSELLFFSNPIPERLVAELASRSADPESRAKLLGAEELDISGLVRDIFGDKESYTSARLATRPTKEQIAECLSAMLTANQYLPTPGNLGAIVAFQIISNVSEFLAEATTLVAAMESDLIYDGAGALNA